ncbi:MAG: MBOAT family protein, partial [Clostridia bacterium]|nr:MBOAT family protein [Clostridia bacterium]
FANEDLSRLGQYIKALFGGSGVFADGQSLWLLSNYAILFVIAAIASTPLCKNLWKKVENCSFAPVLRVLFVVAILVLCTAYVVSSTYNPFIYFRF